MIYNFERQPTVKMNDVTFSPCSPHREPNSTCTSSKCALQYTQASKAVKRLMDSKGGGGK